MKENTGRETPDTPFPGDDPEAMADVTELLTSVRL
jgi:hypothetical protein